jgi:hypothetical protein
MRSSTIAPMNHQQQADILNSLRSTLKKLNANTKLNSIQSATTVKNMLLAQIIVLELKLTRARCR